MKKGSIVAASCMLAVVLSAATAQAQVSNSQASKPSRADQHFLSEAIEGDLAEVNMGKLAQQNGQSQQVKEFGQMLEQDHSQHLQKARDVAQQMGMTAPAAPNAKQKSMHGKLSKLSGSQFDNQFAEAMVKDHEEDITKYQKEAKSKGPLADFAEQTLLTLQKHLQAAQAITKQRRSQR